ncbi:hypothetical protein TNCV_4949161 [Trichonephila clavipes]|nr:hypothetical protein TNCV_4949161 [Trichonephila clavipes]
MKNQKVCDARRITIRRCPVRSYIPNPLRCFQCQRYGHSKNVCRGQPTCPRCGESGHESVDCTKKEQYLNCKEVRRVVLSRTPVSDKSYAGAIRKSTSDKCIQCDYEKDNSSDSVTPTKPEDRERFAEKTKEPKGSSTGSNPALTRIPKNIQRLPPKNRRRYFDRRLLRRR